ncbi:MAG: PorT family protein [Flavobacteriales bacterium]|nr:PorT family protein [Flavobacteriales bacterium]
MKKPIASTALLLACATLLSLPQQASAQDEVGVRFGLKLSPNMTFLQPETKNIKADGTGLGYTFGLMLELPIGSTGNYRFATGLNLNNMKAKYSEEFTYVDNLTDPKKTRDLAREVALQYIELPLTIKLMTNEIGYMRYFAVVGAGNAFNVKAKGDKVEPKVIANLPDEDKTPVVEKFEELEKEGMQDDIALYKASLIVGAGAEYNFSGSTSLMFGLTYNNGFTNILDIDGMKAKAHYVELSLGVFF